MLDRTQSLMGLLWTAKTFYPSQTTYDLNKEVKTFYSKVYLDNNVTNDEIVKPNNEEPVFNLSTIYTKGYGDGEFTP